MTKRFDRRRHVVMGIEDIAEMLEPLGDGSCTCPVRIMPLDLSQAVLSQVFLWDLFGV